MSVENDAINLAEERKRRRYGHGAADDPRPLIRLMVGRASDAVEAAENALVLANQGLYCYGDRLVHIEWDIIRVAGGGTANSLRLFEATAPNIRERLEKAARFEKWDGRAGDFVPCGCPEDIAQMLLARGAWRLPPLLGVVTAPTLRPNGTLIHEPGYDVQTGIVYQPHGVKFECMAEKPTRADALKSLVALQHLLRGFNFVKPEDQAVALSAILTAVVRRAMPVAPMHAFSSPMPGSGKSMLVNIASVIATGWQAAVTSTGGDQVGNVELEKRLTASLLMGDAIVSIDNVDRPLNGAFLCQFLTEHILRLRVLGLSKNVATPNTAMFFATGNNLTVLDDATRRILVGELNPNVERPELRAFSFRPVALALRARAKLVIKALTIIRAYLTSGERVRCLALGSYEEWSRFVREPLIWLGQADPARVLEAVRAGDPRLAKARAVAGAWAQSLGEREVTVREVLLAALKRREDAYGEADDMVNPEFFDALRSVAEGAGNVQISPDRLGWWLKKHINTVITVNGAANYRFVQVPEMLHGRQLWQLQVVK